MGKTGIRYDPLMDKAFCPTAQRVSALYEGIRRLRHRRLPEISTLRLNAPRPVPAGLTLMFNPRAVLLPGFSFRQMNVSILWRKNRHVWLICR